MDPNVLLDRIRDLADDVLESANLAETDAGELAQAIKDLDEWLGRKGFLPAAWAHDQHFAPYA